MIRLIIIFLLVLLSGCATTPEPVSSVDVEVLWASRQTVLSQLQHWKMEGRIAVQLDEQGWQAGMHWHQQNDRYQMDMLDPFGRKVARLTKGAQGVDLRLSKGESAHAANAESLMQRLLGYSLPVSGLRYWVLGIPDPQNHTHQIRLDAAGRLAWLEQSGWEVSYQRYHQHSTTIDLPSKMTLISKGLKVKVVVSEWELMMYDG